MISTIFRPNPRNNLIINVYSAYTATNSTCLKQSYQESGITAFRACNLNICITISGSTWESAQLTLIHSVSRPIYFPLEKGRNK